MFGVAFPPPPPPGAIEVKFCTAKRNHVSVVPAKLDLNRCNESPLRGEKPDFWPVSKFNTSSLPLRGILPVIIALPLPGVPSPRSPLGCSGLTGRDQMVSHSFRGKASSRCAGTSQYPALCLSHMSLKPPVRQGRQQNWRPLARR